MVSHSDFREYDSINEKTSHRNNRTINLGRQNEKLTGRAHQENQSDGIGAV